MSLQSGVPVIDLPVIDLSDSAVSDPGRRDGARRALVECFSSVGFCLIEGLEGYDAEALFKWTKWFHCKVGEDVKLEQLATK